MIGRGRGGAYSFVARLSRSTVEHASVSRRNTVPTPNKGMGGGGGTHVMHGRCRMTTIGPGIPILPERSMSEFRWRRGRGGVEEGLDDHEEKRGGGDKKYKNSAGR